VEDYPIAGYTLPKILTELHLHFAGCGIDYRPLHLPVRALLAIESFGITSNLLTEANMAVMDFVLDNAMLYLSENTKAKQVHLQRGEWREGAEREEGRKRGKERGRERVRSIDGRQG
jgi:hypothetical protein